jgi:thioredoxin-related protein
MRHHLTLSAAFLLALGLLGPASAGAARGVVWRSWDRGLAEAKVSGRPVLVDVYTDWCGWCRRMDADVYARPEIRDYLARYFVTVKLDAEGSDPASFEGKAFNSRSLASRLGVSGYPVTIFLRSAGDHPVSVPGYVDAERFMLVLRYVNEGHLEAGVPFQEFMTRARAEGAAHP